jgi:arylsulfatase A-like enzyme
LAATIDILPTLAHLTGYALSAERIIDGKNIWPLMAGEDGATTPHDAYYFYWGDGLHAFRSGDWKLHLPHSYRSLAGPPGRDGVPGGYEQAETDLALFNLREDVGERWDVSAEHPDVVEKMMQYVEAARNDLGDSQVKRKGKHLRPPGRIE